jgi:hypothetical protein
MDTKNNIIIALLLILAVITYFLGYSRGARHETMKKDAQFNISLHQGLYHSAETGNLQKVQSDLSVILLGEVRGYEKRFGNEMDSEMFRKRFTDAKLIADRVEAQMVPINSILTNFPNASDAKITIK